jgi:TatD DNase family protein
VELIDTHCHLFMEPLGQQVDAVLQRARTAGVTGVVVPAYDVASWDPVAGLAERPGVSVALGLHPWAAEQPLELDRLESLLHSSGAVAVGEIGLDFAVDRVDRKRQIDVLVQQLELARRLDLPVILHCRKAFEALIALVREHGPLRGVVHAFSRGTELAGRLVDELDLHLAFGGTITRRQALRPRHSASTVPGHRLLLETDAPSIGLDGVKPGETEPRHVAQVAAEVAGLRGEALEALAEETTRNARALFALP